MDDMELFHRSQGLSGSEEVFTGLAVVFASTDDSLAFQFGQTDDHLVSVNNL